MLSESHKFIFVHGRKAGGKSIREALRPLLADEHYLNFGVFSDEASGIGRSGTWDRAAHERYRIFINVRNPWDRAVSNYRYFGLGKRLFGHRVGFAEFLDRLPAFEENPDAWIHTTANYSATVTDEHGPITDAVVRFEHLATEFAELVERFDLRGASSLDHVGPGRARMPHRSALLRHRSGRPSPLGAFARLTARGGYRDYYNASTRAVIARRFEEDIDTYRYVF